MTDPVEASITSAGERDRAALLERGRALRQSTRRADQGAWEPRTERDPIAVLERQARTRLPDLVAIRYGRMVASPFAFYRGGPAIMAADLATTPRTGVNVQACGDAHLLNFGLYATPERRLVFDLNDFDETLPGPWEWDLKRLAASLVVAGRSVEAQVSTTRAIVIAAVLGYCELLADLSRLTTLDVWYSRIDVDDADRIVVSMKTRRSAERVVAKARTRTQLQALDKLTEVIDGRRRIVDDPPLIRHLPEVPVAAVLEFLTGYQATLATHHAHLLGQYRLVDAALKVVGVGSVGTRCFVLVGEGRAQQDPLVLQVKEAEPSVLEPHVGSSGYAHAGQRVVAGQRLMQAASDMFLGWSTGPDGRRYYVRQLRDMKGSVEIERMTIEALTEYAKICAFALARAHARSLAPALLAGYCGNGERLASAVSDFAHRYADQTERDRDTLERAVRSGRVAAELGV